MHFLALILFFFVNTAMARVLPILESQEFDIQRMIKAGIINDASTLSYEEERWTDSASRTWNIQVIKTQNPTWPVFFVPHDNEQDALKTAILYLVKNNKGTVVTLECGENRMCGDVDPNRYFCNESYKEKIFSYFKGVTPIIALHNNAEGCIADGGKGTISALYPYEGAQGFFRGVTAHFGGADDVVIHQGSNPPTHWNFSLRTFLEEQKINEIYAVTLSSKNDCSMSYAASDRDAFYFNIDTLDRNNLVQGYQIQFNLLESILNWYSKLAWR